MDLPGEAGSPAPHGVPLPHIVASGRAQLKPYLRVFRGISKCNLPGYLGFFQFLRNFRQYKACEQVELIL